MLTMKNSSQYSIIWTIMWWNFYLFSYYEAKVCLLVRNLCVLQSKTKTMFIADYVLKGHAEDNGKEKLGRYMDWQGLSLPGCPGKRHSVLT